MDIRGHRIVLPVDRSPLFVALLSVTRHPRVFAAPGSLKAKYVLFIRVTTSAFDEGIELSSSRLESLACQQLGLRASGMGPRTAGALRNGGVKTHHLFFAKFEYCAAGNVT